MSSRSRVKNHRIIHAPGLQVILKSNDRGGRTTTLSAEDSAQQEGPIERKGI